MPENNRYYKDMASALTTIAKNLYDIDRQLRTLNSQFSNTNHIPSTTDAEVIDGDYTTSSE